MKILSKNNIAFWFITFITIELAPSMANAQTFEQTMVKAICSCIEKDADLLTSMETPCLDEVTKANYQQLIKRYEMEHLPDSAYVLVPMLSPMIFFDLTVPLIETCDSFFVFIAKIRTTYWGELEAKHNEEYGQELKNQLEETESAELLLELGFWHLSNNNIEMAEALAQSIMDLEKARYLDKALELQGAINEYQKAYSAAASLYEEAFLESGEERLEVLSALMRRMDKND